MHLQILTETIENIRTTERLVSVQRKLAQCICHRNREKEEEEKRWLQCFRHAHFLVLFSRS